MQNVLRKISLGLAVISLPLLGMASTKEISKTQLVPKDAKSLINKTKDISAVEANASNFTGTYTGKRYQYTADHSAILRTYTYAMQVTQVGTQITGATHITSDDGDYAIIKLRGVVISNKMYFEEYEIQEQQKSAEMVWCFKVGELQLGKNKGNTIIYGPTNSYTSVYYQPCTGGYTVLEKEGSTSNSLLKESNVLSTMSDNSNIDILVFPNPFISVINAKYTVAQDAEVQIDLFDINGRLITSVLNESQAAGDHSVQINAANIANGVYVLKMNIGGVITSKQLIKSAAN